MRNFTQEASTGSDKRGQPLVSYIRGRWINIGGVVAAGVVVVANLITGQPSAPSETVRAQTEDTVPSTTISLSKLGEATREEWNIQMRDLGLVSSDEAEIGISNNSVGFSKYTAEDGTVVILRNQGGAVNQSILDKVFAPQTVVSHTLDEESGILSVTLQDGSVVYLPAIFTQGSNGDDIGVTLPTPEPTPEPETPSLAELFDGDSAYQRYVDEAVTAHIPAINDLLDSEITFTTEDGRVLTLHMRQSFNAQGGKIPLIARFRNAADPENPGNYAWSLTFRSLEDNSVVLTDQSGENVRYDDLGSDFRYLEIALNQRREEILQDYPELSEDTLFTTASSLGVDLAVYFPDLSSPVWPYSARFWDVPLE